jgi:hypothetical protein
MEMFRSVDPEVEVLFDVARSAGSRDDNQIGGSYYGIRNLLGPVGEGAVNRFDPHQRDMDQR